MTEHQAMTFSSLRYVPLVLLISISAHIFGKLIAFYFIGTAVPQTCWNVTGLGIRLALEKGLHRRKGHGYKANTVDETEKRAFW